MSPIDQINRATTNTLTLNGKARGKPETDPSGNPGSGPPATDKVSLSEESLQVRELQQQLDQIPEVDAEKVQAIKQAIAQGDYPVDAKKIAANLMNLEKLLSEHP